MNIKKKCKRAQSYQLYAEQYVVFVEVLEYQTPPRPQKE